MFLKYGVLDKLGSKITGSANKDTTFTMIKKSTDVKGTLYPPISPEYLKLSNACIDELYIINSTSVANDGSKHGWTRDTIIKAEFNKDFEGGTFKNSGYDISSLRFKKKPKTGTNWVICKEISYNDYIITNNFVFYDKIVENLEKYEYGITAVCSNYDNLESQVRVIGEIICEFDGYYIFDKFENNYYKLFYNLSMGNQDSIFPNTTVDVIGGRKYPITLYSGEMNYRKSNMKCYLLADANGTLDIRQELKLRNQIMEFLTNRHPKIIKSEDGTFMMVNIIGSPQLTPNNKRAGMYELSFSYVECGDIYNDKTLRDTGFIEVY